MNLSNSNIGMTVSTKSSMQAAVDSINRKWGTVGVASYNSYIEGPLEGWIVVPAGSMVVVERVSAGRASQICGARFTSAYGNCPEELDGLVANFYLSELDYVSPLRLLAAESE